jgi:hypothetical protein
MKLAFPVSAKSAGLPDVPGEFWPVMSWQGPRAGARDDGTVSYYQYADTGDLESMQALRRSIVQKVAARAQPNKLLSVMIEGLDLPLLPQHPHVALYYFDDDDAAAWGDWFGRRMGAWIRRFEGAPETLDAYCWRVLWRKH